MQRYSLYSVSTLTEYPESTKREKNDIPAQMPPE